MKCYFLRHGDAVETDEWSGADFDRPLTDAGIKKMTRAAKTIAALDLEVDFIVTSPLMRAQQTAEIVALALGLPDERRIEDPRLGGGFGPNRLAEVLADHRKADALLLVGHEPGMSRAVAHLVGGADLDFKKGSLARVDIPNPANLRGVLVWLVPAKVLSAAASRRDG
jgi:phosphohistidine phosphatase